MKYFYTILGIMIGLVLTAQAASVFFPYQGGTGTSTVPTKGQVLVGQPNGTYAPQATSTLFSGLFVDLITDQTIAGAKTFTGTTTLATTTLSVASTTLAISSPTIFSSGVAYLTNASSSALTVSGQTVLGKASTTQISATTGATIQALWIPNTLKVTGVGTFDNNVTITPGTLTVTNASSTSLSALTGIFAPNAWITTLAGTNSTSTNSTSTNFFVNGGTKGSIPFFDTGGLITQNNSKFFWDSTNNYLGLSTTTPDTALSVASGTISVSQYNWTTSTSTSMTVDWKKSNNQFIQISTSATTINFVNATTTLGKQLSLFICNPAAGTAGALTFGGVYWPSGTMPAQTTTAKHCDQWSFKSWDATTSPIVIGSASLNF